MRGDLLISLCFCVEEAVLFYRHEPKEAECEKMKVLAGTGEGTVLIGTAEQNFLKALLQQTKRVSALPLKEPIKAAGTVEHENVDDLGVPTYLMNPLRESYQGEDLVRDYLSLPLLSVKRDTVAAVTYAGYVAFAVRQPLCDKVRELGMEMLYETVERPPIFTLAEMEEIGVKVDTEKLEVFLEELETEIYRIETGISEETGESFNLNSPKQLGEILFEKMGLPYGKKAKSGYSIAVDVLEEFTPGYPIVKKILRYRMLTKLNLAYTIGLAGSIRADGRIRGTFHQTITAAGRISLANLNSQNTPIRTEMGSRVRVISVPSPGKVLVDADYSQIELRILAALSDDENLIAAYRDMVDTHAIMAPQVPYVPPSEVTPLQWRNAKVMNFGVVYDISAFGLSGDLSISRNEAKKYVNRYFATYPGVRHFLDRQIEEAKEYGFTRTLFDRIRPMPELKSLNFMQCSFGECVAVNAPIQGTAANIMKIAMIKARHVLAAEELDARVTLQIHDELLMEAMEAEAPCAPELLKETIRHATELHVLLEADMHTGTS